MQLRSSKHLKGRRWGCQGQVGNFCPHPSCLKFCKIMPRASKACDRVSMASPHTKIGAMNTSCTLSRTNKLGILNKLSWFQNQRYQFWFTFTYTFHSIAYRRRRFSQSKTWAKLGEEGNILACSIHVSESQKNLKRLFKCIRYDHPIPSDMTLCTVRCWPASARANPLRRVYFKRSRQEVKSSERRQRSFI